jgi:hypothetical protein
VSLPTGTPLSLDSRDVVLTAERIDAVYLPPRPATT